MTALIDPLTDEEHALEERLNDARQAEPELSYLDRLRSQVVVGDRVAELPAPLPLIDGVLDQSSTVALFGPAGSGKTFVALDWTLCITTGTDWLGHPVEAMPVLYVVGEGFGGLAQRVASWQRARDLDSTGPAYFLPASVNLTHPEEVAALVALSVELRAGMVVIDTLARAIVGADENSARDMGQVVAAVERIREQTNACVLLVHHTGKNEGAGLRGSSALEAGVDTAIQVRGDEHHLVVTVPRQKHRASDTLRERLRLEPVGESCVLERVTGTDPDVLTDTGRNLLRVLDGIDTGSGVATSTWHAACEEVPKRTFYRQRKKLVTLGLTANVGTDKQPRYSVTAQGKEAIGCHGANEVPTGATAPSARGATVPPPLWGGTNGTSTDSRLSERDQVRWGV